VVIYVVIALVAIAVLWGAYRSLGGAASRPVASSALLGAAQDAARGAASDLASALQRSTELAVEPGALPDVARSIRRQLEGCSQMLERVEPGDVPDAQLSARAQLATALDDLSWAARLCENASFVKNSGMQRAVAELRSHAELCLGEADAALQSATPEEVHRSA